MNATEFVKIYRCNNCGSNNNPKNTSCKNCGMLFTKEISFEEWIDNCSQLAEKAKMKGLD